MADTTFLAVSIYIPTSSVGRFPFWRRLKSPLDSKEIKPVNSKGNQPWIFIGRTDAAAEAPILWPPDAKSWFIRKYPDAGKDWEQEKKGTTKDEAVGWHNWLNGDESEQILGDNERQGSLVCPWGHSVRHDLPTEQQQHRHRNNPSAHQQMIGPLTDNWLKMTGLRNKCCLGPREYYS